jgi:hypothetical protein
VLGIVIIDSSVVYMLAVSAHLEIMRLWSFAIPPFNSMLICKMREPYSVSKKKE